MAIHIPILQELQQGVITLREVLDSPEKIDEKGNIKASGKASDKASVSSLIQDTKQAYSVLSKQVSQANDKHLEKKAGEFEKKLADFEKMQKSGDQAKAIKLLDEMQSCVQEMITARGESQLMSSEKSKSSSQQKSKTSSQQKSKASSQQKSKSSGQQKSRSL